MSEPSASTLAADVARGFRGAATQVDFQTAAIALDALVARLRHAEAQVDTLTRDCDDLRKDRDWQWDKHIEWHRRAEAAEAALTEGRVVTGPQEKPTALDRIEAAVAFRADDPEGPQVVTITSGTALALVAAARAAREFLKDDEVRADWGDCVCSYCVKYRAANEALARLDKSAEGGAR